MTDELSEHTNVIAFPERSIVSPEKRFESLYEAGLAIHSVDAAGAGEVGYICRTLVQATLPYRQPRGDPPAWGRTNGRVSLVIQPGYYMVQDDTPAKSGRPTRQALPVSMGYPYGSIPRLLLAWIGREVTTKGQREVRIDGSLTKFMSELGMYSATGGKNGSITRLREQMRRLFSAKIAILDNPASPSSGAVDWRSDGFLLVDKQQLWWDPSAPVGQGDLFESKIFLSERFFDELMRSPVPVDLRALRELKSSPSALDLYCYLTYRMFALRKPQTVPWEALRLQFGSEVESPRKFRQQFKQALRQVSIVYPEARVDLDASGLKLSPSPTSVRRLHRVSDV